MLDYYLNNGQKYIQHTCMQTVIFHIILNQVTKVIYIQQIV
jgi:hypothetical protein